MDGADRKAASRLRRLALVVALLAAALVGDHVVGTGASSRVVAAPPAIPSLAPAGALSSTWYCPALGAQASSPFLGRIIVANPSGAPITATATFVPSGEGQVVQTATIAPYTRLTYKLEQVAPAPFTATTVIIDGAVGAVEQEVQGPIGQSITPCATSASNQWYFAAGRTDTDAAMLLSLYNPFAANAIVYLEFATDQGPAAPDAYQGLVVPPQSDMVVNVGDNVRLRVAISTTVSVTSGRLIVDKVQIQNGPGAGAEQGTTPYTGLALTLGDTAPWTTWYFPDGVKGPGITEHFELYDPSNTEADVVVTPVLDSGSADPFTLTVPAGDRISLQIDQQSRIPPSVGQAYTVTSNVPIVVERLYEDLSPAPRSGVADSMGTPQLGTRWVFAAGSATSGADEYLIVFNPGKRAAHLTEIASGDGAPTTFTATVPPGQRDAIRIGDIYKQGIVVLDVRSDVPVAAERSQANVSTPGLSGSIGIFGGTS